eukprot:Rhum_TRINITY_DN7689_c0_g1::Rhum_TRINITY_DN7689_c0_g1_i1::g.24193::m.24193
MAAVAPVERIDAALVCELQETIAAMTRQQRAMERDAESREEEVLSLRSDNYRLRTALEKHVTSTGDVDAAALLQAYKSQVETSMVKVETLQLHIRSLHAECSALDNENAALTKSLSQHAVAHPLSQTSLQPSIPQDRHWVFGL